MTKLESVCRVTSAGIECVIVNGKTDDIISKAVAGESVGTLFKSGAALVVAKKRWIAYSSKPKGSIVVDQGAYDALIKRDKSLLASGISEVHGPFKKGDVIKIVDGNGKEFARGVTNYNSSEVSKIKHLASKAYENVLGYKGPDEVIHRDNLVTL